MSSIRWVDRHFRGLMLLLALVSFGPLASAQVTSRLSREAMEKLLTPADVEQVTGLKGTRRVYGGPQALGFAGADGRPALIVTFGPANTWEASKSFAEDAKPLSGVGVEAVWWELEGHPEVLLRSGAWVVQLSPEPPATGESIFGLTRLTALAKILASRM